MNNKKVEITLPVYNEEKILKKNVQKIVNFLDSNYKNNWHITIAENGSVDETFEIAKDISRSNKNISVIQTEKGRGNAIKKSWGESGADYLIYMDIDLSTQPEEIPSLINKLNKNDIAIGSRFLENSSSKRTLGRKIISKIYNLIVNKILGVKIKDSQCGFKGLRKEAKYIIEKVNDPHWFFDTELLYRAKKENLKIAQVPISWNERQEQERKSKVNIVFDSFVFLKNIFKLRFENKILTPSLIIFTIATALFLLILIDSKGGLCPDSFYHAKLADIIWESKNIVKDFPWLPFTILGGGSYVDHHLIFHIIISPFIGLLGFYGFKIIIPILGGILVTSLYILFKKNKINNPVLFSLLIFLVPAFIYRVILFRSISLSIILIIISYYFIIKKRYILLALISYIFVLTYNAFPLLILLAIIYALSEKIIDNVLEIKNIISVLIGIFLGLLINPYFPANIDFLKTHIFKIPFTNGLNNISVGMEWYPIDFKYMLTDAGINFLLFSFSLSIIAYFYKKNIRSRIKKESLASALIAILFFLMTLKSQRFIEYWVPFTIISVAFLSRDSNVNKKVSEISKRLFSSKKIHSLKILIILILSAFFVYNISLMRDYSNASSSYNEYENASLWMKKNIKEGEIIINQNWDDFPELFYWNDKNNYVAGMDMMFLCNKSEGDCNKYTDLQNNKNLKIAGDAFKSKYILVDKEEKKYNDFLQSSEIKKLYDDKYVTIFEIKK